MGWWQLPRNYASLRLWIMAPRIDKGWFCANLFEPEVIWRGPKSKCIYKFTPILVLTHTSSQWPTQPVFNGSTMFWRALRGWYSVPLLAQIFSILDNHSNHVPVLAPCTSCRLIQSRSNLRPTKYAVHRDLNTCCTATPPPRRTPQTVNKNLHGSCYRDPSDLELPNLALGSVQILLPI